MGSAKDIDFGTTGILKEYDKLALSESNETVRRNLARVLHDCLRVLLRNLGRGQLNETLGEIDIRKRFRFIVHDYPALAHFEMLVSACKSARDKIEHHDSVSPTLEELAIWRREIEALIVEARQAFEMEQERSRRAVFDKKWLTFAFEWELGEKKELVNDLRQLLVERGLVEAEINECEDTFMESYEEYAELSTLEEAMKSEELWLKTDYAIAAGTLFLARQNGYNNGALQKTADAFAKERLKNRNQN